MPKNYVTRKADRDIYETLKAGEFCYIFNSRLMGKSSLMERTRERLKSEDFACIFIDLSHFGTRMTQEQWYASLINEIAESCAINFDLSTWWQAHSLLSPIGRLGKFIEEVVLVQIKQPIVIFIDEVDFMLHLQFSTDDFFAFIRFCYNKRADNPSGLVVERDGNLRAYNRIDEAVFNQAWIEKEIVLWKNKITAN